MSLAYSERRRLLDWSVGAHARLIRGRVLEIEAGRAPRRGRFVPQRTSGWWTLDLAAGRRPHIVGEVVGLQAQGAALATAARLEPLLVRGHGALISATTGYLALGRK